MKSNRLHFMVLASLAAVSIMADSAHSATVGTDFDEYYNVVDLGPVPGLPMSYGGLTLLPGSPNTLLIGGNANTASGRLYTIDVVRGDDSRIVGFSGDLTPFGDVGAYNDGGVTFGPEGVLFTARWPVNQLGQTKPGSTVEDRVDNLAPFGIGGSSVAAINFVPSGFAGSGELKAVSWSSGNWYTIAISADGSGTFNIDSATQEDLDPLTPGIQSLPGGPEGFVYVSPDNPGFSVASLLVSDFSANRISAYDLDGDGNPLVATRRDFITGLTNAEGAFIDPLTGDFLFSTFGTGSDRVFRVEGFVAPDPIPVPPAVLMLTTALFALFGLTVKRGRPQVSASV